ncbi:MAG: hypothetical protein WBA22_12500 [Candidatus Methanofastidiosia archaeon]
MTNQKKYFKKPKKGEFIKAYLPVMIPLGILAFLISPALTFIKWAIWGSGPFVLYPTPLDKAVYSFLVVVFVLSLLKGFLDLYKKMQNNPFLTITEEGVHIITEISAIFTVRSNVDMQWSHIYEIKMHENELIIDFQKGEKKKTVKIHLRWVPEKEKEDLITTLREECKEHEILWEAAITNRGMKPSNAT